MPFGFGLGELLVLLVPVGVAILVVREVGRRNRNRREAERIERQEFMDEMEERLARRLGAGRRK